MNVKDILSQGEELLFKSQQCRWMPGGKEITPSEIFVTNQRIIIETSTMLGLHKDFQDLHYSDVEGIELKKGILSSTLIIKSRFKGDVHINAIPKKQAGNVEQIINEGINRYVTVVVPNENNYVVPEMTDYQCSNCQKVIHYVGTDLQEHDRLFCLDCLSKMPSRPVTPDDVGVQ